MDASNKPFRLLDLPPELWSRIVKLAVSYHHPLVMNAFDNARLYVHQQPAISRVCQVLRDESLSHYYGANVFCIDSDRQVIRPLVADFADWLEIIGATNATSMGRAYFRISSDVVLPWIAEMKWHSRRLEYREVTDEKNEEVEKVRGQGLRLWGLPKFKIFEVKTL